MGQSSKNMVPDFFRWTRAWCSRKVAPSSRAERSPMTKWLDGVMVQRRATGVGQHPGVSTCSTACSGCWEQAKNMPYYSMWSKIHLSKVCKEKAKFPLIFRTHKYPESSLDHWKEHQMWTLWPHQYDTCPLKELQHMVEVFIFKQSLI